MTNIFPSSLALLFLMAGCVSPGPVDLGNGRSIYMECLGNGSPTVILVAGGGERADDWMSTEDEAPPGPAVYQGVASFTRVCAYNRPGTVTKDGKGWKLSRSTPLTRLATADDSAVDLNALLSASGERGPYVLVGHSLGGPIIRLYAPKHPETVAGFVFVDALSEDLGDGLTETQSQNFEKLNDPEVQGKPSGSESTLYSSAVVPLLRAAGPPPHVPTIILTADLWVITPEAIASGALPPFVDIAFSDALWASQQKAQDKFAAKFPGAKHITKTNSSHYIHRFQPQLVIDSIREVVEQVRQMSR